MKPVGLVDPRTGRTPYAVVQLRQDNLAGDHFSLVGFQTQLKWGEQARVLQADPRPRERGVRALRHGAPQHVHQRPHRAAARHGRTKARAISSSPGQMSGVEGYVESAASGLIAGRNAAALVSGERSARPPRTTAIGALAYYVSHADPAQLSANEHHVRHHAASRQRAAPRATTGSWPCRRARFAALDEWIACSRSLISFLEYLRLNRNTSSHTVAAYRSDLSQFLAVRGARSARAVRAPRAVGARAERDTRVHGGAVPQGQSRSSVARKLSALRTFVRFLRREGWIDARSCRAGALAEAGAEGAGAPLRRRDVAAARVPRCVDESSDAVIARCWSCSTHPGCG